MDYSTSTILPLTIPSSILVDREIRHYHREAELLQEIKALKTATTEIKLQQQHETAILKMRNKMLNDLLKNHEQTVRHNANLSLELKKLYKVNQTWQQWKDKEDRDKIMIDHKESSKNSYLLELERRILEIKTCTGGIAVLSPRKSEASVRKIAKIQKVIRIRQEISQTHSVNKNNAYEEDKQKTYDGDSLTINNIIQQQPINFPM